MRSNRYERQIPIEQIGEKGQERFAGSDVLVVGAGGLGSPLLYALAGAGVGRLTVVDGDRVSLSNLNRQFLYSQSDVGEKKAEAAAARLKAFNPEIRVDWAGRYFKSEADGSLLDGRDAVAATADNIPVRILLNRLCAKKNIPLINGGVEGLYGVVEAVEYGKTPCLECYRPPTRARKGSGTAFGAVSCAVASLAANVLLSILLGKNPVPGEILVYDGVNVSLEKVKAVRNPECRVCGKIKPRDF